MNGYSLGETMKTANVISENLRVAETGLKWEEKLTNAQGTLILLRAVTFRVRATGATTVTIDGVLAATMSTGEIMIFNTGHGNQLNTGLRTINVVIGGANAFVQVAAEAEPARTVVNPLDEQDQPFPDADKS
jgi:hypothetical protein